MFCFSLFLVWFWFLVVWLFVCLVGWLVFVGLFVCCWFVFVCFCFCFLFLFDDHLYSAILRSLEQTHCARLWFYMSDKLFL